MEHSEKSLLSIRNLVVHYETDTGVVEAVNDISLDIYEGETLGLVGETGAGKTTTALSIMRLVPAPPGHIVQGSIEFEGEDLLAKNEQAMRKIRGNRISMIFQDPMTSLNPVITVGEQIEEVIRLHRKVSREESARMTVDMLKMVGIPPERSGEFPHQFSGGMKQRVGIAIALACNPKLLIADEPTTALDVTIQAQVLDLMRKLERELKTSMLLITHDLGVVAEICDRVAVIYAGSIVEHGTLQQIFRNPTHPYTRGLFASLPSLDKDMDRLHPIPGLMPDPADLPSYCSFYDRCQDRVQDCESIDPPMYENAPGHFVKCLLCANACAGAKEDRI